MLSMMLTLIDLEHTRIIIASNFTQLDEISRRYAKSTKSYDNIGTLF